MVAEPRLFQRKGRWTFRVRVPDEIRGIVGKNSIYKALGTVDAAEARRLARVQSVSADALFAKARAALRAGPAEVRPSDEALAHFARRYLADLEAVAPAVPFDEIERAERVTAAEEAAFGLGQSVEQAGLQATARQAARDAGLPISLVLDAAHARAVHEAAESDAPIRPKLRRAALPVQPVAIPATANVDLLRVTEAVQRALVEHFGREADRNSLQPERVGDPLFVGVGHGPSPAVTPTVPSMTLRAAVDAFMSDVARAHLTPATRGSYRAQLAVVVDLLGAGRLVSEITRADVREARDALLRLPSNASKRWPGVPLRQVADRAARDGLAPMSPKTALHHVEMLSGLFRWLCAEELAPHNPARGIAGPVLSEETDRRPFSVVELNTLFASSRFNGSGGRGWMYWMPRLALFTGARFAELIGLRVSDLVEVEGVICISIEPTDVRRLKTKGSRRHVPVHAELTKAGFLDHIRSQPTDGLIFRDAVGPQDLVRATNQAMGRAIREVFADKNVVFHSFRHTFKDAADAVMPREIVARLGGWDLPGGRGAMDSYGRATLARKMADEMSKVTFPGVRI